MDKSQNISIVIPNYNTGKETCRLIESIKLSNFNNYDITVVDDFSTDNSVKLLKALQVPIIQHKKNRGPAAARNTGARSTSGGILFFIDSDVEVYPDTLMKIYKKFKEQADIAAIVAIPGIENYYRNISSLYFTSRIYFNYLKSQEIITFTCSTALAVRREVFDIINGFNERITKASVEDGEFGMEISKRDLRIYLDKNNPVRHNKKIGLLQLIKNDMRRAIAKLNSSQFNYRIKEVASKKCYASIPHSQLISLAVAPAIIFLAIYSIFYPRFAFPLALTLIYFFFLYRDYLIFMRKRQGFVFLLKLYFLLILDMFFVSIALLYGCINLWYSRMTRRL